MEENYRIAIRKNIVYLNKNLIVDETLLSHLVQEEILTDELVQCIKAEPINTKKASTLLDLLPKRGQKAFAVFIQALRETQQEHLANTLTQYMNQTSPIGRAGTEQTEGGTVCNIPRTVSYYQQRISLINEIEEKFRSTDLILLTGIHGSGKSQLSLAYLEKHADRSHAAVNWRVKAWSNEDLKQGLIELSKELGMKADEADEWQAIYKAILGFLHRNRKNVLHHILFDNICENCSEQVEKVMKDATGFNDNDIVKVLMTSNFAAIDISRCITVARFEQNEAVEFFTRDKYFEKQKECNILSLGKKLGFLPFAMAAARTYITKAKTNITNYLKKLENENEKIKTSLLRNKYLASDYNLDLMGVLSLNLEELKEQLNKEDEDLFKVFQMTAFFSPEDIPLFLLMRRNLDDPDDSLEELLTVSVEKLSVGSVTLFDPEENMSDSAIRLLTIHDAVSAGLTLLLSKEERVILLRNALLLMVNSVGLKDTRFLDMYHVGCLVLNHVLSLLGHAKELPFGNDSYLDLLQIHLLDVAGYLYWKHHQNQMAETYLVKAVQLICKFANIDDKMLPQLSAKDVFTKLTSEQTKKKKVPTATLR